MPIAPVIFQEYFTLRDYPIPRLTITHSRSQRKPFEVRHKSAAKAADFLFSTLPSGFRKCNLLH